MSDQPEAQPEVDGGEKKSVFKRDQVVSIINSVISKVGGGKQEICEEELFHQLRDLKSVIEDARKELGTLKTSDISDKHIPTATDELDAIVEATAEATGSIMDACESIESTIDGVKSSAAENISTQVTNIYEACTFQDITGQRISKVVSTLKEIEEKVNHLVGILGHHPGIEDEEGEDEGDGDGRTGDDALLNGPQLPGNSISQDEIDKLLADFD